MPYPPLFRGLPLVFFRPGPQKEFVVLFVSFSRRFELGFVLIRAPPPPVQCRFPGTQLYVKTFPSRRIRVRFFFFFQRPPFSFSSATNGFSSFPFFWKNRETVFFFHLNRRFAALFPPLNTPFFQPGGSFGALVPFSFFLRSVRFLLEYAVSLILPFAHAVFPLRVVFILRFLSRKQFSPSNPCSDRSLPFSPSPPPFFFTKSADRSLFPPVDCGVFFFPPPRVLVSICPVGNVSFIFVSPYSQGSIFFLHQGCIGSLFFFSPPPDGDPPPARPISSLEEVITPSVDNRRLGVFSSC